MKIGLIIHNVEESKTKIDTLISAFLRNANQTEKYESTFIHADLIKQTKAKIDSDNRTVEFDVLGYKITSDTQYIMNAESYTLDGVRFTFTTPSCSNRPEELLEVADIEIKQGKFDILIPSEDEDDEERYYSVMHPDAVGIFFESVYKQVLESKLFIQSK